MSQKSDVISDEGQGDKLTPETPTLDTCAFQVDLGVRQQTKGNTGISSTELEVLADQLTDSGIKVIRRNSGSHRSELVHLPRETVLAALTSSADAKVDPKKVLEFVASSNLPVPVCTQVVTLKDIYGGNVSLYKKHLDRIVDRIEPGSKLKTASPPVRQEAIDTLEAIRDAHRDNGGVVSLEVSIELFMAYGSADATCHVISQIIDFCEDGGFSRSKYPYTAAAKAILRHIEDGEDAPYDLPSFFEALRQDRRANRDEERQRRASYDYDSEELED